MRTYEWVSGTIPKCTVPIHTGPCQNRTECEHSISVRRKLDHPLVLPNCQSRIDHQKLLHTSAGPSKNTRHCTKSSTKNRPAKTASASNISAELSKNTSGPGMWCVLLAILETTQSGKHRESWGKLLTRTSVRYEYKVDTGNT